MIIEIFRTGKHTDSSGVQHTYTEADLDKMVSAYNPASHEAPVVLGHPVDNAPAYGWVKKLVRTGQSLFAELGDLCPEFVEWVNKKLYKKRSIALYPDGTLRHVGFLGAMPPAIKGLADVAFSQAGQASFEFMDSDSASFFRTVGRMFSSMRDFIIEKYGQEKADAVIPSWDIDWLKQAESTDQSSSFTDSKIQPQGEAMNIEELQAQNVAKDAEIAALKTQNQTFSETVTAKDAEIAALTGKLTSAEKEKRTTEHAAFCEKLIGEGRLAPKMKDATMSCLEIFFKDSATQQFAEGTKIPYQTFREQLQESPIIVEFREVATKQNAKPEAGTDDHTTIAKAAREYQDAEAAKGNTISISEAVEHVSKK